jgi:hypothetical protein
MPSIVARIVMSMSSIMRGPCTPAVGDSLAFVELGPRALRLCRRLPRDQQLGQPWFMKAPEITIALDRAGVTRR